ncbi:MAG: hypothetical protein FWD89_04270 [Firmicutes bacterium]|nr:hypothetical protein [Bacillota bacterium]
MSNIEKLKDGRVEKLISEVSKNKPEKIKRSKTVLLDEKIDSNYENALSGYGLIF